MQKISILLFCIGLILQTTQQIATATTINAPQKNESVHLPSFKLETTQPFARQLATPTDKPVALPLFHHDNDLLPYFLKPISFTQQGIAHYFTYTYNHEKYTEYLPYNFSHMIQFLEFGQEQKQDERYAKSIIKLFLQKIKGCDFINSYSLLTAMPKLCDALTPYVQKKEGSFLQELQQTLKNRFSTIFSTYHSYFQKNPDAFLDALSEQIAKKTNEVQTQQHIDVEHVRKDILRFLELCMNKLIWSPQEGYDAWVSINELADRSHLFLNKKLITDTDALDDIYWSLIHRFCYYLDIANADISQEKFIAIINDIHTQDLILLQIEEQEEGITNKKDYLLRKIKNYCPYVYNSAPRDALHAMPQNNNL